MPPELHSDYAEESGKVGTLELEGNGHKYFNDNIDKLLDLAKGSGVSLPSLTKDSSIDDIRACTQKVISSLLESINTSKASAETQDSLSKCLSVLKSAIGSDSKVLTADISKQLVTLLIKETHLTTCDTLFKLLMLGQYEITKEEGVSLNKLFISSNSTSILELLIVNKTVSIEAVDHIITNLNSVKPDHSNYPLYKTHLLIAAQGLRALDNTDDAILSKLLDFFKICTNQNISQKIVSIFKGTNFFEPICQEVSGNLLAIAKLLEIDRLSTMITKQSKEGGEAKDKLKTLLEQPGTFITDNAAKVISKEFTIKNKSWSISVCKAEILKAESAIKKTIVSGIPVNKSFIHAYQQYLQEILDSSYLIKTDIKNYRKLLMNNTYVYDQLLRQGHNLSWGVTKSLLDSLSSNEITLPSHIQTVSSIVSKLLLGNKIPNMDIAQSIALLKRALNSKDILTINNIVLSFQKFALLNIQEDSFTNEVCSKYLVSADNEVKDLVLKGLGSIISFSYKLPEETITSLRKFIEDKNQDETLRIKAIELLQKVPNSLSENTISLLSGLLTGEKRSVEVNLAAAPPLFALPENTNSQLLNLEYLQLEKHAYANGFKLQHVSSSGNGFFESIVDQLKTLGEDITEQAILSLVIKELKSNPDKYQSLLLNGDNIEECIQSLASNKPIADNMKKAILQAIANILKTDINIYGYNGTLDSKKASDNPHSRQINIGSTEDNYLSLLKLDGANSKSSNTGSLASKAHEIAKVDYIIAKHIAALLVKYISFKGSINPFSINDLEKGLHIGELSKQSLKALSIIAVKNPSLLKSELLKYIKENDLQVFNQISFNTSLQDLSKLLNNKNAPEAVIKENLSKLINVLTDLSAKEYPDKLDLAYDIVGKLLVSNPALFKECLQVVQLLSLTKTNVSVIDQLIDFKDITYLDLCRFVDLGCKSSTLNGLVEKYFNDNISVIKDDPNVLGRLLFSLQIISCDGKLQKDTIDNLITVAKTNSSQSVNIIKICHQNVTSITDSQFVSLEELFKADNVQLSSLLCNLFDKANKQLTTPLAVTALFKNLGPGTPLKILPSDLIEEAQLLLKLKASVSTSNKLELLEKLKKEALHSETVKVVLSLAKNKDLTKSVIKIIANLVSKPLIDKEVSEIICLFKDELTSEYDKLKPLLTAYTDEFAPSLEQTELKELLKDNFADLNVTDFAVKKVGAVISSLTYSKEFTEQIILGNLLSKAHSIEEFCLFLEFLLKNKLSETGIACYLNQPNLTKIMDIIESKILSESLQSLEQLGLTNYLKEITNWCYKLKAKGWAVSSIAAILHKINKDNIGYILSSFKTIHYYRITEGQRNKDGDSVLDIINKYSGSELEPTIYSIVSNQFEHKDENTGLRLLQKIIDLNPKLESKATGYLNLLEKVYAIYSGSKEDRAEEGSTKCKPVGIWSAEQIKDWATKFKDSKGNIKDDRGRKKGIGAGKDSKPWPKEEIAEVIAVLERANNLCTSKNGKAGHLFRDTQIISLLLLLDSDVGNSGKLLQVATGEGKSAISATLAAILALYGYKVDLITSSKVLASSGMESAKGFFALLGLTCGLNTEKGPLRGYKGCYDSDIVYGDTLTFQSDFLSNTSNRGPKRGDREFAITIVDEVDSMLLDGSSHFAKQASPTPLMEYLSPVLAIAWHSFHTSILPLGLEEGAELDETTKMIEHLISTMPIPKYLVGYAEHQAKSWAKSLIAASTQWELDKDYVINTDSNGRKVINPVDNSTGVTQESMVWQNGLHQFLQIKHNCRVSAETLTSFFITNISYFLKYDKILGMTGTLGAKGSQDFLRTVYGVELAFVPPYKDKQLIELPGRLEPTKVEHLQAIVESSYQEAVTHNRAVLVVCKTIKDVEELISALKKRCGNTAKIINYSRSEEKLYNSEIAQITHANTIVVATNLAGRGTDIKTSLIVEENGGLHVISTFIAKNARDEEQVKGRTSRQGNCGSYQIIALDRTYHDQEVFGASSEEIINAKRQARENKESEKIQDSISHSIPKFLAQDKLYDKFSQLFLELAKNTSDNSWMTNSKINQLVEDFGIWLKTKSDKDSIENFLTDAKAKYHGNNFTNPSYLVTQHYGLQDGRVVINALSKAIEADDIYNFAAHYYTAKAYLNMGKKQVEDYKNKALDSLMETGNRVSELLAYLTAMSIVVAKSGTSTTSDNELFKQIINKVHFFKEFKQKIETAIAVIKGSGDKEVRIKSAVNKQDIAPELSPDDLYEIDFLGVDVIFDVETYKPKQKWFATIFAGCCSVVQMTVGALITLGSLGTASGLGVSVFTSGLMDAYKVATAVSKGRAIKLDEYLTSKAIDYAIIGAQVGFTKIAQANAAKKGLEEGVKQAALTNTTTAVTGVTTAVKDIGVPEVVMQLFKTSGVQLAKTIALEKVVEWASDEIRDNLLDGLEGRIESSIYKVTKASLENNSILLTPNCNIERDQIQRDIQAAVFKATRTQKFAQVTNELASGVFKAASSSKFGLGTALYAAHKIGGVIDGGAKIEPVLDDIKEDIRNIINRAGIQAQQRLQITSTGSSMTQSAQDVQESFSKNIGSMVSSSVMNLVQRKVTAPIVSHGVSEVIDKLTEKYQKEQQDLLAQYAQTVRSKAANDTTSPQDKVPGGQQQQIEPKQSEIHRKAISLTMQELELVKEIKNNPSASQSKGELINKLSTELNKQIYLFKDNKLVESYGKGKSGGSISIAYDSKTGKYYSLSGKDSGSYGSIYEALAASHGQGNYSAGKLVKMHHDALMAASKEVQKGETGTGVAPDRVPDKPTSKDPNQTVKPGPILTKETEEHLKSVFGGGKSQAWQIPGKEPSSPPNKAAGFRIFGTNSAEAGSMAISPQIGNVIASDALVTFTETVLYASALGARAIVSAAPVTALYAVPIYMDYKKNQLLNDYISAANNHSANHPESNIQPSAASFTIALSMFPDLDPSNRHDFEIIKHLAVGIHLKSQASNQSNNSSAQPAATGSKIGKQPAINFKEQGRVDNQGPKSLITPYTEINPNAGKPSIETFPVHDKPKSILFTPDDRSTIAKHSQLPGFSPIPAEITKGHTESFPDQSHLKRWGMILTLDKGQIREIIGKRIDLGVINVGSGSKEEYIVRAVDDLYKKIGPYQREGTLGGAWDNKIVGFGQKTGTAGHAETAESLAVELAKNPNVKAVFLNQGINKIVGLLGKTNFRPDVAYITEDGKIHVIEVQSDSDKELNLRIRTEKTVDRLKKPLQGSRDVVDPNKVKK